MLRWLLLLAAAVALVAAQAPASVPCTVSVLDCCRTAIQSVNIDGIAYTYEVCEPRNTQTCTPGCACQGDCAALEAQCSCISVTGTQTLTATPSTTSAPTTTPTTTASGSSTGTPTTSVSPTGTPTTSVSSTEGGTQTPTGTRSPSGTHNALLPSATSAWTRLPSLSATVAAPNATADGDREDGPHVAAIVVVVLAVCACVCVAVMLVIACPPLCRKLCCKQKTHKEIPLQDFADDPSDKPLYESKAMQDDEF